jgi:hypothetical protein
VRNLLAAISQLPRPAGLPRLLEGSACLEQLDDQANAWIIISLPTMQDRRHVHHGDFDLDRLSAA